MICFRDTTFCVAPIHRDDCQRRWTDELATAADLWWQSGGGKAGEAPVAFADFCTPGPGAEQRTEPHVAPMTSADVRGALDLHLDIDRIRRELDAAEQRTMGAKRLLGEAQQTEHTIGEAWATAVGRAAGFELGDIVTTKTRRWTIERFEVYRWFVDREPQVKARCRRINKDGTLSKLNAQSISLDQLTKEQPA